MRRHHRPQPGRPARLVAEPRRRRQADAEGRHHPGAGGQGRSSSLRRSCRRCRPSSPFPWSPCRARPSRIASRPHRAAAHRPQRRRAGSCSPAPRWVCTASSCRAGRAARRTRPSRRASLGRAGDLATRSRWACRWSPSSSSPARCRRAAIVASQCIGYSLFFFLYVWVLPISFIVYAIAAVGETNRAPFDLAEGEGELVGGFHTEYSSLKFALFFLAEYVNMVTVSALATTLFLGGWPAPWPISTGTRQHRLVAAAVVRHQALGVPVLLRLVRGRCPGALRPVHALRLEGADPDLAALDPAGRDRADRSLAARRQQATGPWIIAAPIYMILVTVLFLESWSHFGFPATREETNAAGTMTGGARRRWRMRPSYGQHPFPFFFFFFFFSWPPNHEATGERDRDQPPRGAACKPRRDRKLPEPADARNGGADPVRGTLFFVDLSPSYRGSA